MAASASNCKAEPEEGVNCGVESTRDACGIMPSGVAPEGGKIKGCHMCAGTAARVRVTRACNTIVKYTRLLLPIRVVLLGCPGRPAGAVRGIDRYA